MDILINGKSVHFDLQGEKNLGEVLKGLEEWSVQNKHFISEVRVNEELLDWENPDALKRSLAEVNTLHCEVLSPIAYVLSVWSQLQIHLEPFKRIDSDIAADQIKAISERLEWLRKMVSKLDHFFEDQVESQSLIKNLKALELGIYKLKDNPKEAGKVQAILQLIEGEIEQGRFKLNLRIMKAGLKPEASFIRNSIENYIVFVELLEEKLLQTAVNFQKSKLRQGIDSLPELAEGLALFFVINSQVDGVLLPEMASGKIEGSARRQELADTIKQQMEALEAAVKNQDYVDAADIIEYEIKELLPELREVLTDLLSEVDRVMNPVAGD